MCNGTTAIAIFRRCIIILNLHFHTQNDKLIFKNDYEDPGQQQKGNLGYVFYQQEQEIQSENQSQLVPGIMQRLAQVMGMGADSINLQQQQHEGIHPSYLGMFLF